MGSNTYPSASASLLGNHKDVSLADVPVEQLRKLVPSLLSSQPEQKYEIVKKLQELKHICRVTGYGCSCFEESQYWYRCCSHYRCLHEALLIFISPSLDSVLSSACLNHSSYFPKNDELYNASSMFLPVAASRNKTSEKPDDFASIPTISQSFKV
ncbi:hypothetical protein F2Q70_00042643 [Brassica cretica]|uniref:Uncharacterized protein n=1 Tax=Brassica cretica TaxID=69181 RepID=A0A8S9KI72_BRACR|nr:hypothetical protein F2Q70_00042643 [Brassica cretica]